MFVAIKCVITGDMKAREQAPRTNGQACITSGCQLAIPNSGSETITGASELTKTLSSGRRTNRCSESLTDNGDNVTWTTVGYPARAHCRNSSLTHKASRCRRACIDTVIRQTPPCDPTVTIEIFAKTGQTDKHCLESKAPRCTGPSGGAWHALHNRRADGR